MRYYVYFKDMESGKTNLSGVYQTYKNAIEKITALYKMDEKSCMKGRFYYYMKEV